MQRHPKEQSVADHASHQTPHDVHKNLDRGPRMSRVEPHLLQPKRKQGPSLARHNTHTASVRRAATAPPLKGLLTMTDIVTIAKHDRAIAVALSAPIENTQTRNHAATAITTPNSNPTIICSARATLSVRSCPVAMPRITCNAIPPFVRELQDETAQ